LPRLFFRQQQCDELGLFGQLLQAIVEAAPAEVEPALQRLFDAHVEPRLDAFAQEIHRYRIDQHAGQNGDQGEKNHQTQRESGTKNLVPELAAQAYELIADQSRQAQREQAGQSEQHVIIDRKHAGIGAAAG